MRTKDFLKGVIPAPLIKFFRCWQMGLPIVRFEHRKRVKKIKEENHATVVFLISSLSMWRYQGVYDILTTDKRFDVSIVFAPFALYAQSEKEKAFHQIEEYFRRKNIEFYDATTQENAKIIADKLDPDIIFYPQHYSRPFFNCWDFKNFKDRLICYIPYALYTLDAEWTYMSDFNTVGWRLYYASSIHQKNAQRYSSEYGKNVRVVGEPHADEFLNNNIECPWPDNKKKRIIYAPHFQIEPNEIFYRPSFLWTHDILLELAQKYSDSLQFAFKPHPRLFSALCSHPDWGEEKAKDYYDKWAEMPNAQIENGEFINLFKTSDALLHDCGSFTAEYQYTKKPCMFLTQDENSVKKDFCAFGMKCFDNHYIGKTKEDVINFIENVVLKGNDPKELQRKEFFEEYLLPPNGMSTCENIYNDLVNSLFK